MREFRALFVAVVDAETIGHTACRQEKLQVDVSGHARSVAGLR
jgi:hypothetical protein